LILLLAGFLLATLLLLTGLLPAALLLAGLAALLLLAGLILVLVGILAHYGDPFCRSGRRQIEHSPTQY
jgi:hypothetical protein